MSSAVQGACACGRNRYQVQLPRDSIHLAEVQFDTSNATRQQHASPFATWLRVPLEWYHSVTIAHYADETGSSIRRTFETPFASYTRRQFCGYCGTQLTSWNERTKRDADYISLTLGSLFDDDLELLEELGLLPGHGEEDEDETQQTNLVVQRPEQYRGTPWFESMIQDTAFGRLKMKKGGHASRNGAVKVEWEIVEYIEGDEDQSSSSVGAKRKIGDVDFTDVVMK